MFKFNLTSYESGPATPPLIAALVAGWGIYLSEKGKDIFSKELQEINVTVISNSACVERRYTPNEITDNMMCAIGYGRGHCSGDSGGPLVALTHHSKCLRVRLWFPFSVSGMSEGCSQTNVHRTSIHNLSKVDLMLPTLYGSHRLNIKMKIFAVQARSLASCFCFVRLRTKTRAFEASMNFGLT